MCWYCPHTGSNLNQSAWRDASGRCLIDALIQWLSTVESAQSKQRTGELSVSGSSHRRTEADWQNVYELQITAERCRLAGLRAADLWPQTTAPPYLMTLGANEAVLSFLLLCRNIILMCDWEVHIQPPNNEVTLSFHNIYGGLLMSQFEADFCSSILRLN